MGNNVLKLFSFILLIALVYSCQIASVKQHQFPKGRNIASGQTFTRFLQRLSKRTKIPTYKLEKSIISFIKDPVPNSTFGNHVALGLTDDQARRISSLSDDLPYMDKVRKWAMENITLVNKNISRSAAEEVFEAIVVKSRGVKNPYKALGSFSTTSRSRIRRRQQQTTPITSLSSKQQRLLSSISEINSSGIAKVYRKNLSHFQLRGKTHPSVLANGQEIIESATTITKKTGLRGMGDGCENFSKTASKEILETKANLDIYRARLIEDAAHAKAGRTFASVDDIPKSARLTQEELDVATRKAFQDVLGYTDEEATMALKRLKQKPCRIY